MAFLVIDSLSDITAPLTTNSPASASKLTLHAQIRSTSDGAGGIFLADSTVSTAWGLRIGNGLGVNHGLYYGAYPTDYTEEGGSSVTDSYQSLTMVFDGSLSGRANRLKLYVDGTQATLSFFGSGTVPGTVASTLDRLTILAADFNSAGGENIALWVGVALTAEQVVELHKGIDPNCIRPDKLAHYWPATENLLTTTIGVDCVGGDQLGASGTYANEWYGFPKFRRPRGHRILRTAATGGTGIPTLSAATVFNITGTTAQPRVTLTF